MRPIRDIVAEAIRGDGSDLSDTPWASLPPERQVGWLGDADRALEAIRSNSESDGEFRVKMLLLIHPKKYR